MLKQEVYQKFNSKAMLEKSVEKFRDRVAFWTRMSTNEACPRTYSEAYSDVCGLGTSLIRRGMQDKRIAIIGENSYEWVISYLAVIGGVGAAIPLDKSLSINELKYFLNITGCCCAIFSGTFENVFLQIRNDGVTGLELLINMDQDNHEGDIFSLHQLITEGKHMAADADPTGITGDHAFLGSRSTPDALCMILFTAGTTGVSKGVRLSHANIAAELALVSAELKITESDVFFSRFPLHCAWECICGILLPLCRGASITFCEEIQYSMDSSSVQGYGLTECASIVTIRSDNGSAGRPLSGMQAKIVCPDPDTGIGELCLAGENIMLGYCANPEATDKVLKDGWLYTGDLGKIDEAGYLYLTGRIENVIHTLNGTKVYPEELESRLNSTPYVQESLVWGKTSHDSVVPVVAVTILADEKKAAEALGEGYEERELEELLWMEIHQLSEKQPAFQRIETMIVRKEAFQKNSAQKIIRWYPSNRQ